jgi:acyl-CoA synthetase (AMP-forming)/AMP-acid ligase II
MLTHRDMLQRCASAYGPRIALVGADGTQLTYHDLNRITDALAAGLIGSGLQPGDRVVWLNDNCLEFLVAYFATAKAGLVFSPMNFWLRAGELSGLVALLEPRALMAGSGYAEILDGLAGTEAARVRVLVDGARPGWTSWADLLQTPGSLDGVPRPFTAGTERPLSSWPMSW